MEDAKRERRRLPDWRVLVVGLGTMVVPLDSAVNVAFPAITGAFGLSLEQIRWIVIVYMLAQTSLMLVFGRIGDMVGYKRVFLLGSAVSAVAMTTCSVAPSYGWLLGGRVVQGVGAGPRAELRPCTRHGLWGGGDARAGARPLHHAV